MSFMVEARQTLFPSRPADAIPALCRNRNSDYVTDDGEKANTLNKVFSDISSVEDAQDQPVFVRCSALASPSD